MTYRMFIDDERDPPEDGYPWVVCRTSTEAIASFQNFGAPRYISFDHDLGGDDTAMVFVRWLINYCLDYNISLKGMTFYVHSQNPIGAENITSLLSSFKGSQA